MNCKIFHFVVALHVLVICNPAVTFVVESSIAAPAGLPVASGSGRVPSDDEDAGGGGGGDGGGGSGGGGSGLGSVSPFSTVTPFSNSQPASTRASVSAVSLPSVRHTTTAQTARGCAFNPWLPDRGTRAECNPQNPTLFSTRQCQAGSCICVHPVTGISIVETVAVPGQRILCDPAIFDIRLGFQGVFSPAMANPSTAEFHQIASRVTHEMLQCFGDLPGLRTISVVAVRNGSIIVDLVLTSIGHSPELLLNVQPLKQPLDAQLKSGSFAGLAVLPSVYEFRLRAEPSVTTTKSASRLNVTPVTPRVSTVVNGNVNDENRNKKDWTEQPGDSIFDRELSAASLLTSPGVMAAGIAGCLGCLLLLVVLVLFCAYRCRKADAGSYALSLSKPRPAGMQDTWARPYQPTAEGKEFYA